MSGKARIPGLPKVERPHVTATVAKHTASRLGYLVYLTGLSKGQVLDLALDAIGPCETCQGIGRVGSSPEDAERCPDCSGMQVVPTSFNKNLR